MFKIIVATAALVALAGCMTTNETPLAPNAVRLDTSAQGLLFTGQTGAETMKKAAQSTIAHGYSYFKFADVSTGNGERFAGVMSSGSANVYGNDHYASVYGQEMSTPIYSPTSQVGVTVLMFNTNEPGSWNAADVLAKNGKS